MTDFTPKFSLLPFNVAGLTARNSFPFPTDLAIARYQVTTGLELRNYVQHDVNHNITSVSDTFANVIHRYVLDAYGNFTIVSPTYTGITDSISWRHVYQGKEFDYVTQLFYFNARFYSPGLGRFLQEDPILHADGMNA